MQMDEQKARALVAEVADDYFSSTPIKAAFDDEDEAGEFVWSVAASGLTSDPEWLDVMTRYPEKADVTATVAFAGIADEPEGDKYGVTGWSYGWNWLLERLAREHADELREKRDELPAPLDTLAEIHLVREGHLDAVAEEHLPVIARSWVANRGDDWFYNGFMAPITNRDDWTRHVIEAAMSPGEEQEVEAWDRVEPLLAKASVKERIAIAPNLHAFAGEARFTALLRPLGEEAFDPLLGAFEATDAEEDTWYRSQLARQLVLLSLDTGRDLPDAVLEEFEHYIRSSRWVREPDVTTEAFTILPLELRKEIIDERTENRVSREGHVRLLPAVADDAEFLATIVQRAFDTEKTHDEWIPDLVTAFARVGEPMVPVLMDAWDKKLSARDGELVVRSLGALGSPDAADVLVEALGHSSKSVRTAAQQAVEGLGAAAIPALKKGVDASRKATREASAALLERAEAAGDSPLADIERQAAQLNADNVAAIGEDLNGRQWNERESFAEELVAEKGVPFFAALSDWLLEDFVRRSDAFIALSRAFAQQPDADQAAWVAVDIYGRARDMKKYWQDRTGKALVAFGAQLGAPLAYRLKGADSEQQLQMFEMLIEHAPAHDLDVVVGGLENSSKVVRELCVDALVEHFEPGDYLERVAENLSARKKAIRLAAAQVLSKIDDPSPVRTQIEGALDSEKTADVTSVLEQALSAAGGQAYEFPDDGNASDVAEFLANLTTGKLPTFLELDELPALKFVDGTELGGRALEGFVARLTLEDDENADEIIRQVRPLLDDDTANEFSVAVKDQWAAADGKGKDKWAIYQQGVLAGEERINEIAPKLAYLTANGYHHLAGWYVDVLQRNGSRTALSWLLYWVQNAERRSLKTNAREAWQRELDRRDITSRELEAQLNPYIADDVADAAVPRLEVDEPIEVDYGSRTVEIFVDQNLKVHSRDDKDKVRDSMPRKRKDDDPELVSAAKDRFSTLKSKISRVVDETYDRLEDGMVTGRRWSKDAFTRLFVDHPLMARIAGRFVFSTDDDVTFRLSEGEFIDTDYSPVKVADDAQIRLVHRLEMSDADAGDWGTHLADEELIQPFPQVDRPTFSDGDVDFDELGDVARPALAGRLRRLGWRNAPAEDAGMVYGASKTFAGHGVRAEIDHGGFFVGQPGTLDDPIRVRTLRFRDIDGSEVKVDDAPAIAVSEALFDVARMHESR